MSPPTRYQFLRDRRSWDASLVGLEPDGDGNLLLASLPGPSDGVAIMLPAPFDPPASGIVAGPCSALFVADTANDQVIFFDGLCAGQANLRFLRAPRGLAVGGDALWAADSGNARVRRFAFPTLELDLEIEAGMGQPTGVACDGDRRLYVLDRALRTVRRYGPHGTPDSAYDSVLAASGKLADPLFLAIGAQDALLVADNASHAVRRFDATGKNTLDLATPADGWRPGAIAAGAGRIFVADRNAGRIHVFRDDGTWWCELPGFTGPVTALALDPATSDLLIKTALDGAYLRFPAGQDFAASGRLVAGPFDAGERCEWFRAACEANLPRGASIVFEVAQGTSPTPRVAGDWTPAPAPDTLLAGVLPPGPPPTLRRFLWLRATVATTDPTVSPTLRGVRAETAGEDYRAWLPAIYTTGDEPAQFLFRLLALARTELGDVEENIDAMPLLLAPDFAPASQLDWLAAWLGLELPRIADAAERRTLIARAATLWRRRGTPSGLAELVEMYTGVRPSIIEAFAERGLWVLDVSSRLGFDTGLPALNPVGMIVPDPTDPLTPAGGCCATTVGSAIVGESGPLPVEDLGEPLFTDAAHRFLVFLPSYRAEEPALVAEVRRIIEAEKPAHTGYDLCLVRPDMRVGFQATVGLDTIVGAPPEPMRLDQSLLGQSASLTPPVGGAARIGQGARVGANATQLR
jgi:phage tail-like protein